MEKLVTCTIPTSSSSLTLASVFFLSAGSSMAKAGYPEMQSREASVSLELDSFGRRLFRMTLLRYWASGSTWMMETREPCSPNRFIPSIASSAAFVIPMELEDKRKEDNRVTESPHMYTFTYAHIHTHLHTHMYAHRYCKQEVNHKYHVMNTAYYITTILCH